MTGALLIAAAMAGQIPVEEAAEVARRYWEQVAAAARASSAVRCGDAWTPPVGSNRAALEFQSAVEEWVERARPGAAPADIRRRVAALGSPGWRVRDEAQRSLEAAVRADPMTARWLFAARRDRDPEIAYRVNGLLRRLNPCPDCKGRQGTWYGDNFYPCHRCDGTGLEWRRGAWDD